MRWQSTWPSKDIFHEYALDFAKKVNDMTGGDLKIDVLPAGAVVPAFQLLDAVSSGTLDGGHGVAVYHYGKAPALALWGSGPGFGMDANMLLSWHKYGGGKELLDKLYGSVGANVRSFLYGPMPTQPLGWFKKPITKVDDLKGLKFRTVGISIDVFTGTGRGGQRAARAAKSSRRWIAACSTRPSSTTPRRTVCSASPTSRRSACCRAITRTPNSSKSCSTRPSTMPCPRRCGRSSRMRSKPPVRTCPGRRSTGTRRTIVELQSKDNVKFYKTPDAVLKRQLEVYDEVVKKRAGESPVFKEIIQSQIAFAERATRWEQDTVVNRRMAFDHYFGQNAAAKKL